MDRGHRPVLLEEAIAALMISADGAYVDGTFGRGGHSTRILDVLSPLGTLAGFDQDPAAAAEAERLAEQDSRFRFQAANFRDLGHHIAPASLQGVLLDLGVSSPQLDDPERGFSFSHDGPLDMRMNPEAGRSAAEWLSEVEEAQLAKVLHELGEERYARRIAAAIVQARSTARIERTAQLAEIVSSANPKWEPNKHPATRSFQAIRLHINGELAALHEVLEAIVLALAPGGRMVVISFHSLEDRVVKRFIRDHSGQAPKGRGGLPMMEEPPERLKPLGKARYAGKDELRVNVRSRSAVLRVAEKVA